MENGGQFKLKFDRQTILRQDLQPLPRILFKVGPMNQGLSIIGFHSSNVMDWDRVVGARVSIQYQIYLRDGLLKQ